MADRRARFKLPIAANKIVFEELPQRREMLETLVPVGPMEGDGPVLGEGLRKKKDITGPLVEKATESEAPIRKPTRLGVPTFREGEQKAKEHRERAEEAPKPVEAQEAPKPGFHALAERVTAKVQEDTTVVHPEVYIPSNRRAFSQFIIESYWRYYLPEQKGGPDVDACKKALASSKELKTFSYQAFVRDYIQKPTPYRGVLVYHGLGSGKTCTSIAAMEALFNGGQRPIYVMTPASLRKNYIDEISKCGPFVFRTNNFWQWVPVPPGDCPQRQFVVGTVGIPDEWVTKNKGAWVPDPGYPANFHTLEEKFQKHIQQQIAAHIQSRFTFINYNGLSLRKVMAWACPDATEGFTEKDAYERKEEDLQPYSNFFDGATVIIDEVHNLIRTINNSGLDLNYREEPRSMAQYYPKHCKTGKKYKLSYLVYRMLCNAVGCKIIALSGTPIINYPQEIAILANVLSGDTRMVEATLPAKKGADAIVTQLQAHPEVDFVEAVPKPAEGTLLVRITPVPSGCRKVIGEGGAFRGFVRDATLMPEPGEIARERDLNSWFQRVSAGTEMKKLAFMSVPRLPDLEDRFRELFVDTERLEIKESVKLALMARLSGLISYYRGSKADLMARVTRDDVIEVDMSNHQLKEYTVLRKEELDREEKTSKQTKPQAGAPQAGLMLYDQVTKPQSSTFKIFSRAACNFTFPEGIPRPRPKDFRDLAKMLGLTKKEVAAVNAGVEPTDLTEEEEVLEEEEEEAGVKAPEEEVGEPTEYEEALKLAISTLRARKDEFFSKEALLNYSPKFQAVLDNLDFARGPALVYSLFKTLEGVGLFGIALEAQKGYKRFDITPLPGGGWTLAPETREAGPGTPRYISYTGDDDAEKRNILKAVFNAAWGKMPPSLAEEIKALSGTTHNQQGEIAKVFMITASGAEGISLSNVRQVHIMEPYWNYVRLDQVKGRAIRICSHMDLPPEERTVDVFTYVAKFSETQVKEHLVDETLKNKDSGITTDQSILAISNKKKHLADSLFGVMQSSAVDCELNKHDNKDPVKGVIGCYRLATKSMEPLFHPLVAEHLRDATVRVAK
jgi:hypothetical protein